MGKSDSGWIVYTTRPFESVCAGVGDDVTTGVETIETSAPRTSFPLLSLTVIRTWIGVLLDVTGFGEKWTASTMSRSPSTRELAGTELPPPPPPPPASVTLAVGSE